MITAESCKKKQLNIFVMSDSLGETAEKVTLASVAQFQDKSLMSIKKFPYINTKERVLVILQEAKIKKAILVTTFADHELNAYVQEYALENHLKVIDCLTPLVQTISEQLNEEPTERTRAKYRLDDEYFKRIAAIEFAVKYDDGKDPRGFPDSDVVLLGISRTSKTPVSIYLAHKGYKACNLPLIPEIPLPKEIYEVDSKKLIGLVVNPITIMKFRQSRLDTLGMVSEVTYSEMDRIKEELRYQREVFRELGATVIDVNHMSIEETAQKVIEHIEQ